jgi:SAM-dependent methyltransferase
MTSQLDEFKTRQRAVWSAGDYAALSGHIADIGEAVVGRADIAPGTAVLDVACGTGNAARPAARAGAHVTGLDLTPSLLAAGRAAADREGLGIEWVEGDAEQLPFGDGSFDRVLSTVGHMFAPRHRQVADELARVCRPGGLIVTASWTPDGVAGRTIAAGAPFMPPPPDYASPPPLWGREDHVREMFAGATGFEFERRVSTLESDSLDGFLDFFVDRFGPLVTARQLLGDRFPELRERIAEIWSEANEAQDGSLRLPQEYLLSVVRM